MPAKRKNPPRAPFAKRFWHTFYLVQPVLQFAALLSLLLVFGRCSPLNPSTDKVVPKPPSASGGASGGDESFIRENQIVSSLQEISRDSLSVVSDDEFAAASEGAVETERATRESDMKSLLDRQEKKAKLRLAQAGSPLPILKLSLTAEQQQQLWRDGSVRIALQDHLQATLDAGARRLVFRKLQGRMNSDDKLHGRAYLVLLGADDALQSMALDLKISFGALSDEQAYLELRRSEKDAKDALLISASHNVRKLAVVLE